MPKGVLNKRYTREFKKLEIETMPGRTAEAASGRGDFTAFEIELFGGALGLHERLLQTLQLLLGAGDGVEKEHIFP